jgi:zinc/manganese transport system permease protein
VIGVVYAVSSAAAVLVADRSAHGAEQVRTMLIGNLLAVRPPEVVKVAILYALIGLFHWLCRRPFFLISTDPGAAYRDGWRVRLWDFLFYASFGVVVTSSVRIAGVLLVFSYLIVPALAGILLGRTVTHKLCHRLGLWHAGQRNRNDRVGDLRLPDRSDGGVRVRAHADRALDRLSGGSASVGAPDAIA